MSDTDKSLALILITVLLLSFFPISGYVGIILLLSHLMKRNRLGDLVKTIKQDWGLMALLSALGISVIFATNRMISLASFALFCLQLFLYIMIRSKVKTPEDNHRIIKYLLIASIAVSAFGIFQYYFINHMPAGWIDKELYKNISNRAFSTMYNPNVLGSYLIIIISIALSGFKCTKNLSNRLLSLVILVLAYLCMVLTFSRGAWLGLAASILVVFIFSKEKPYILTVLGSTLLLTLPEFNAVLTRMKIDFLSSDSSSEYRLYLWQVAEKVFSDNPITGTGLGSFGFALPSHANAAGYLVSHAHNIYLQFLAETGILGFIAFFGYIAYAMYICIRVLQKSPNQQTKRLSVGVLAAFVGLLVHGTVDATMYLPQLSIFVWLILAVQRNMGDLESIPAPTFLLEKLNPKPVLDRIFFNHQS